MWTRPVTAKRQHLLFKQSTALHCGIADGMINESRYILKNIYNPNLIQFCFWSRKIGLTVRVRKSWAFRHQGKEKAKAKDLVSRPKPRPKLRPKDLVLRPRPRTHTTATWRLWVVDLCKTLTNWQWNNGQNASSDLTRSTSLWYAVSTRLTCLKNTHTTHTAIDWDVTCTFCYLTFCQCLVLLMHIFDRGVSLMSARH